MSGDFSGVGESVAELFAGENDGNAVPFGTKFVCDAETFVKFVLGDGDDGVIEEGVTGIGE